MKANDGNNEVAANRLKNVGSAQFSEIGNDTSLHRMHTKELVQLGSAVVGYEVPALHAGIQFSRGQSSTRQLGVPGAWTICCGEFRAGLLLRRDSPAISSTRGASASTWVPSFTMSRQGQRCGADFGMFLKTSRFSLSEVRCLFSGSARRSGILRSGISNGHAISLGCFLGRSFI
jgi:hypothetical protein